MSDRKVIYICAPVRGDVEANIARAGEYTKIVVAAGHTPIVPHKILSGVLDDNRPNERATALNIGLQLVTRCDEVWVFGGRVSAGMKKEIDLARCFGIPVRYKPKRGGDILYANDIPVIQIAGGANDEN
jgi:hypothetical protein